MSATRKWPSGYRELDDLVREYGRDQAQSKLMSGQWPASKCNLSTGDLEPIPVTAWGVRSGRGWLEEGASGSEPLPGGVFGIISYTVVVRLSERRPTRMDNARGADGPKVRLAKDLMDAALPQGEWRQMGVRTVRKRCEEEAKTRRVPLPSPDSFSRAMARRRK